MGTKKLGILFLFSVILAFAAGYFSSNLVENKMVIESDEIFEYITKAFDEYYYYDIDSEEVYDAFLASMYAAVDSYAESNDDPYTRITAISEQITPTSAESFVGMGITFAFEDHRLRVSDVYSDSDLFEKVFPNDLIIGYVENGNHVYFDDLDDHSDVINYFSGDEGDIKDIIVTNPDGIKSEISFALTAFETPTAYSLDLGVEDIGYIKISEFSGYEQGITPGTNYVFNDVLNALEDEILIDENDTLIIDLRDNPGGDLTALNNKGTNLNPGITQLLLPYNLTTPIFSLVDKNQDATYYYGGLSEAKTYDIKVLVNQQSASASEVLAAALLTSGYQLYGMPTYGKGVFQNSIYLNDIQNVRYYLTYTEGIWQYGDGLNVETDPLTVTEIIQTGILTIDMPVYDHQLSFDMVDESLIDYQRFINEYFNLDEGSKIRTDGYFDDDTKNYVLQYQMEHALNATGEINLETAQSIFLTYKEMVDNVNNDQQLMTLLEMIDTDA